MIAITRSLLATICRNAEAAYPYECCGLLIGREDGAGGIEVSRIAPSANLAADRRRRFEVDPALYLTLERTLPGAAERLVGLYHSHPDGAAIPSAQDAAAAWEEGWIWLIVPVRRGRAGKAAAHRLTAPGGPFEAMPLALR